MKNEISRKYIKKLIVNYLSSNDEEVILIYDDLHLQNSIYGYSDSIKMNNFVDFYLSEFEYCYDVSEIKNIDVFELIIIFLNIFLRSKFILKKYKNYYLHNKLNLQSNKSEIKFQLFDIDKKIYNKVKKFLNNLNIDIIKKNNLINIDISKALFLNKNEKEEPTQKVIDRYWRIKKHSDKDSIDQKYTYLCRLKSELDDLVKNGVIANNFLKIDTSNFRSYVQSLFSHKGGKYKNKDFEKIKKEFDNSDDQGKNKILDDLFDALVLMYLYNKILN